MASFGLVGSEEKSGIFLSKFFLRSFFSFFFLIKYLSDSVHKLKRVSGAISVGSFGLKKNRKHFLSKFFLS